MAESLLEFPCSFPIKIMGRTEDGFAQLMLDIVLRHVPDFDSSTMEMRASREGKYLSLTCVVNATSREQLDESLKKPVKMAKRQRRTATRRYSRWQ